LRGFGLVNREFNWKGETPEKASIKTPLEGKFTQTSGICHSFTTLENSNFSTWKKIVGPLTQFIEYLVLTPFSERR